MNLGHGLEFESWPVHYFFLFRFMQLLFCILPSIGRQMDVQTD